jgi:hypothetical protein
MSDTTTPQEAAESGLPRHDLFGLRVFESDRLNHAQFMADQVTEAHGMTFGAIVDKAWRSRPKRGKICGEEIFRLRAFEHLQNAVYCGKLRKEGKIYLPNADVRRDDGKGHPL